MTGRVERVEWSCTGPAPVVEAYPARDLVCPIACDDDCDQECHVWHMPSWRHMLADCTEPNCPIATSAEEAASP